MENVMNVPPSRQKAPVGRKIFRRDSDKEMQIAVASRAHQGATSHECRSPLRPVHTRELRHINGNMKNNISPRPASVLPSDEFNMRVLLQQQLW